MDKKWVVTAISTIHTRELSTVSRKSRRVSGVETIQKPTTIDQYNKFMGGMDKSDQLVTYYGFYHHSKTWWKWVSFTLLMSLSSMLILPTARWQQVDDSPIWNSGLRWLKDWLREVELCVHCLRLQVMPCTCLYAWSDETTIQSQERHEIAGCVQGRIGSANRQASSAVLARFHFVYIPAFITSIPTRTTSRITIHVKTPFSLL